MLEEDWAKDSEGAEQQATHFLLRTFWVVEELEEGHASRRHLTNQCFEDSKLQHLVQQEEVVAGLLQLSLSFLHLQQQPPCSAPNSS